LKCGAAEEKMSSFGLIFKKLRCITKNRGEQEHPTHNKTKEA